MVIGLHSFNLC